MNSVQAPKMIITDMDGTLLDATGTAVSARNAAALGRASDAGVRVVIATGRPIWWLQPVIDAGFTGTAVCMNGAVTYDIDNGQIVDCKPLSSMVMTSFVTGLTEHADTFAIAVERLGVDLSSCWAEPAYDHPWGAGEFRIADRAAVLAEPAAKMLIRAGRASADLARAAHRVRDADVHITYSTDDGLIEIAAAGVNKGTALAELARRWGVDPATAVAFGDMPNDLEMLNWAGYAVAMSNAHAEVLAAAAEVAPANHEDGVAAVLERWF